MQLFIKLLIKSLREALLLRYAPEMKKQLTEDLGEWVPFYFEILKETKGRITSRTLDILLRAEIRQKDAFIPTLPLELAVIEIVGEGK